MNVRWQQLKSVFGSVMELTAGRRKAYISAMSRPSLAVEIRKLLAADERSDSLLDRPAWEHESILPESFSLRPAVLDAGEVLADRFEVAGFLGKGGMGEVYRVWDREMGCACALKTLRGEVMNRPELASRLRKEALLARLVTHRNVCRLHDIGRARTSRGDEVAYFTMELLEGRRISDVIREKPAGPSEALPLILQLLDGLEAAHRAGVIHRDLKSGNVFLENDRVVITDFGLALASAGGSGDSITAFGENAIVGTPAYMAPEQVEGGKITPATDIYAVGVVMFELLTGRLPFEAETPLAMAVKRLNEPALDLRSVAPGVPRVWHEAVAACLRRDPATRPSSAAELRRILTSEAKPPRVLPRRAVLAGACGTAAAGAAAWILWPRARENPEARRHFELGAEFAKRRTKEDLTEAVKEFETAVRIDPKRVDAWTGLVDAYTAMAGFNFIPSRLGLDRARDAAQQAVRVAPRSAKAQGALGWTISVDVLRWRQAEPYLKRAVELDPGSPVLRRWYGGHLGKLGRFPEAIAQMQEGLRLEPASMALRHGLTAELFRGRRFAEFHEQCLELVRIQPLEASSHHALARSWEWRGELDRAIESCDQADRLRNTGVSRSIRGCVEALRGHLLVAWTIAEDIDRLWRDQQFESSLLAGLWMRMGEVDRAITTLLAGFDRADSTVITALTSPYFDSCAAHPSFAAFRRRLGAS